MWFYGDKIEIIFYFKHHQLFAEVETLKHYFSQSPRL